jgi:hypothetical protein
MSKFADDLVATYKVVTPENINLVVRVPLQVQHRGNNAALICPRCHVGPILITLITVNPHIWNYGTEDHPAICANCNAIILARYNEIGIENINGKIEVNNIHFYVNH